MPLALENFAKSKDGNSLLDLSKDILFLGAIGQLLLTCELTLETVTVFAMLELIKLWKLFLTEVSAVLSLLDQKGEKHRCKFDSNLFGMHPDPC